MKDGTKIGEHDGVHRFTVGQRKGLNIGGLAEPVYVVDLDPQTNQVIVGSREDLKREGFVVNEMHWVNPTLLKRVEAGEEELNRRLLFRFALVMRVCELPCK